MDKPDWEEIALYSHNTKVYVGQWESLSVINGVLYRLWETPAGHLGIAKTLGRVRERFYCVQCRCDVQDWCRKCDVCARRRGPHKKTRAPMAKYNVGSPMEHIAMDILGSLPTFDNGNKYMLVVSDYFTRWVRAYSIADQENQTIADVLTKEFICRFGVPLLIHTDQGRNFESKLMAEVCELLDIKKTRTTAYHPQSDGMVERFNQTLEAQLSKFADHNQQDWDQHLPFLMMAYRSAVHDTTGNTSARMMFGRDLKLPVDLCFGRQEEEPITVTKRLNDLVYRIQLRSSTKPKVVHRNRLWLYSGDDPPSWFQGHQSDSSTTELCRLLVL